MVRGTRLAVDFVLALLDEAAFRRAFVLDTTYAPALEHLIDVSFARGDSGAVRQLGTRYVKSHPIAEAADFYRWRVATVLPQADDSDLDGPPGQQS